MAAPGFWEDRGVKVHPNWGPPEDSPAIRGRFDHGSAVTGVAIDAAARSVVSSCRDGTVWLWRVQDGDGDRLCAPGPRANGVAIAPDGLRAVSAHADGCLMVWDLVSGRPTATLVGHGEAATRVRMTADGRALSASRYEKCLILWDLDERAEVRRYPSPAVDDAGHLHAIAFTGDATRAVSGSSFGVHVWDLETGVRSGFWNTGTPYSLGVCTISLDQFVVVARSGGGLDVWDIAAPGVHWSGLVTAPRSMDVGSWLWAVAPAGMARVVVATDRGRIELWDALAGTRLAAVLAHGAEALDVAVAADGRTTATASNDETVTILDLAVR